MKQDARQRMADVALRCGADGLIVGNTSSKRAPDLSLSEDGATVGAKERGGLSGEPIRELSLAAIRGMYQATDGKIPIVGCGGISTGEHAYAAIRAGASLLQLYTAMVCQHSKRLDAYHTIRHTEPVTPSRSIMDLRLYPRSKKTSPRCSSATALPTWPTQSAPTTRTSEDHNQDPVPVLSSARKALINNILLLV